MRNRTYLAKVHLRNFPDQQQQTQQWQNTAIGNHNGKRCRKGCPVIFQACCYHHIHHARHPLYVNGDVGIRDTNTTNANGTPTGTTGPGEFNPDGTPVIRVRLPKKKNREQFGCAQLMMGANHIKVRCADGVERMGRIKGKIKKRAWIREGDILIIVPWSFQDEKCDILHRYLPPQVDWLRKNNYL